MDVPTGCGDFTDGASVTVTCAGRLEDNTPNARSRSTNLDSRGTTEWNGIAEV
jgi:hypothetical protein